MCLPLLAHIRSVYLRNRLGNTLGLLLAIECSMLSDPGQPVAIYSENVPNKIKIPTEALRKRWSLIAQLFTKCPGGCVKNVCWSLTIDGLKFCVRPEHLSVTCASLPTKFLALIKCKYLQISLTLFCLIHCIINSSCRTQMYNNCWLRSGMRGFLAFGGKTWRCSRWRFVGSVSGFFSGEFSGNVLQLEDVIKWIFALTLRLKTFCNENV